MPRSHAALEQQIQELTRKNNELQEQVRINLFAPCLLCSDHYSLRPLCCLAAACSLLWQHQHTGLPAQAQAHHTAYGPVQPGVGDEVRRSSSVAASRSPCRHAHIARGASPSSLPPHSNSARHRTTPSPFRAPAGTLCSPALCCGTTGVSATLQATQEASWTCR